MPNEQQKTIGKIEPRSIVDEIQESYLDYAMSVIISRALPDVRDGLKPVHRRILYAMQAMGLRPGAKFRKSAHVIGEVMAKFHPHGDMAIYDSMVRMAQDFSLRYPLVWGQGNFGCFTKDTKVKLTDGRDLSFKDLVKEHSQGKINYTYTINSSGLIEIAKIKNPRRTRKNTPLVQITLDNGARIKCTPNHLFMLKDGSYKEARYLSPGESLMPIYQRLSTYQDRLNREGYILIYQNKKDEWVPAHHLADNYNLSAGHYYKEVGRVRHHLDFNKMNNSPDNITRIAWGDHWKVHYEQSARQHKNPEYCEKIANGRIKFWSNPHNRAAYAQRLSERNRKNWQDPNYRKKMRQMLSNANKVYIEKHPERRVTLAARASKTFKRLWGDPHYRHLFHEKIVAANKKRVTNNTGKTKFLKICKGVLDQSKILTAEQYEQKRMELYAYGRATAWETGIQKYYNGDVNLILCDLNKNHKVLRVNYLKSREDVYDLTIDKYHNFALSAGIFVHNSMDGDSAAAHRYTEAKLAPISEELLQDIEKDTVIFNPNYDGTHKEPSVLPTKLPNLLLNGSMGIAVGMATNIPPHNLGEVCAAVVYLLNNPDCGIDELMKFIPGPDFPTGGLIYNKDDIKQSYATGRGSIVMRGRAEIVDVTKIIITEIPYGVNKADLVTRIADLVRDKKIEGIRDLRDESNKDGVRVVIDLKKDAYPKKVLNQLFDATPLQTSFHVNMLALIDGIQPRLLNLKMALEEFIKHREEVVKKRTAYDLARAKERAHILEGLKIAILHIDKVITTIKKSQDRDEAKVNLIRQFKLTDIQAVAILEMRLQQLANLERLKVENELKEKKKLIEELEAILASKTRIRGVVKHETEELTKKFGDKRRTEIISHAVKEFRVEDLVPDESTIVMVTADGYIKRLPPETFKQQGRGGKGVLGVTTKEEDVVEHLFSTTTHADLLFFTTRGRVFKLKAYEIPQATRTAKGQAVVNFLELSPGEKVSAVLSLKELGDYKYLVMVTNKGLIKKVDIEDFDVVRRSGLIAIKLKPEDNLEWIKPSSGKDEIVLVSAQGQSIRFSEGNIRSMGRVAAGVRGMRLKGQDHIVGMDILEPKLVEKDMMELFVLMENGFGKRSNVKFYKLQGRGGSGVKTAKITDKTGKIVGAFIANTKDERDLIVISQKGQVLRTPFRSISVLGRATQGVRVMRFKEADDRVANVTFI